MRIAFISDIHGNVLALDAVLSDIRDKGADAIVCAGDLVAFGPRPREVMARLGELDGILTIQGNTERWLGLVRDAPEGPWDAEDALAKMAPALRWTLDRLPGEAVDELTGLGKAGTLEMEGFVIEVEHASPGSDWVGIQPGTSTAKLEEMLAGLECHVFVCGHTHKAIIRNAERMLVVNVGSVGYPYDTIKRPSWALLSSSPERIEAVIHRVDYDRDAVVKDIAEVGMAMGDVMTRRLETAEM